MMYRILLDGHDIYGSNPETAVIDPHLDIELNSAGSLEFTLPVDNYDWDTPQVFTNEVEVIEDGEVIFFGRPLQITRDWNNQKKVVCEGALAYFNDTIQRTHEYKTSSHTTLEAFFRHLIDVHNSQVDDQIGSSYSPKHFEVGTVDLENKGKYVYRKTDYQTTLECLQQMCLDTDGGYFVLRKEYDNDGNATRYIDWLEQMPYGSDQPVQFGLNLLDLSRDLNGADICTVLIPLGGENLTLSNFSSKDPDDPNNIYPGVGHVKTSDEIYYKPGIELYGRVVKQKTWSDYTSQDGLWRKAAEWLTRKNDYIPTIEVDAADLHYIDEYKDHGESLYSVFRVGMAVQVISKPHGFDEDTIDGESHPNLIIHKLSLDLDSATKKVTIGTPPKRELTDILAPSSGGKTTKGSGGNGDDGPIYSVSEIYPVTEIMIKKEGETEYSSAIANKTAYIDLTNGVGGRVKDVQVDEVSIVDENGVANLDSSAFGTDVEANPTGTPSAHLTAVEIDGTVYDIPGGSGSVTDVQIGNYLGWETVVDENGIAKLGTIAKYMVPGGGGVYGKELTITAYNHTAPGGVQNPTTYLNTKTEIYSALIDPNYPAAHWDLSDYYQRALVWDDCFDISVKMVAQGTYKMFCSLFDERNTSGGYGIIHNPFPILGLTVRGNEGGERLGRESRTRGSSFPVINFIGRNGIKTTIPYSPSDFNSSTDVYIDYDGTPKPNYTKVFEDASLPSDVTESTTIVTYTIEKTGSYLVCFVAETNNTSGTAVVVDGPTPYYYQNDTKTWAHDSNRTIKSVMMLGKFVEGTSISFRWAHGSDVAEGNVERLIVKLSNTDFSNSQVIYSHGKYLGLNDDNNTANYAYNKSLLYFEISINQGNAYYPITDFASIWSTKTGETNALDDYYYASMADKQHSGCHLHYESTANNSSQKTFHYKYTYKEGSGTRNNSAHDSLIYAISLPLFVDQEPLPTEYVTDSELNAAIATLQSNFQDGVDDIYQACISKGSTPASYALADVVAAVQSIPQNPEALPPLYSLRMKLYAGVARPTTDIEGRNGMYIPLREDGTCNLPFTASPESVKIVVRFKLSNNSSGNIQALFGAYNGSYWHLPSAEFGSNSGRIGCGFARSNAWDNWIALDTTVTQDIWYYYEYFWSNAVLFSRLYDDAKNLLEEKSEATAATMYVNTSAIFQFGGLLNMSDHYTPGRGLSIDIMKTYVDVNGARVFGSTVGSSNNGMGIVAQAYGTAAVRGNAEVVINPEVSFRTSAFNGG